MYLVDTRRPCSCTGTNSRRERKRTEAGYFRDTDVGSAKAASLGRGSQSPLPGADRQAFTPLGAPALQDSAAVLRGHADEKTVGPLAAAAIGLIRTLHWTP